MSYQAILDDGSGGDVATLSGWAAFREWVSRRADFYPELVRLVNNGASDDLKNLAEELDYLEDDSAPEEVASIGRGLWGMLERSKATSLVITDGVS